MTGLSTPTGLRLIKLFDPPPMLRGRAYEPALPSWPQQALGNMVSLGADFTGLCSAGASIIQIDHTVTPPGAADVRLLGRSGLIVVVRCRGAVVGTATVSLTITLADGEQISRAVQLPIVAASAPPPDPNAVTVNDQPLTYGSYTIT